MPASSTMLLSARAAGDAHDQREVRHQAVVHRRTRWPAARRRSRPGGGPPSGRCDRPSGMPCIAAMVRPGRRLLLGHRVGGLGVGAVAVGLGRLGAQHQRQHRLGAEAAREEAQRAHAERHARRARLDAGLAQQARPVLGVTLLGGRELQEHVAALGRRRTRRARGTARRRRPRRRTSRAVARCASRRVVARRRPYATHAIAHRTSKRLSSSVSSPTSQRHRPCGAPTLPAAVRSRARRMPQDVAGADLARRRRRRACRRSSAPSASRTRWRGSRSAARRRRGRASCDSSTRRTVVGALRALAAERWRSRARRGTGRRRAAAATRSSGSGTHHAVRARNGSGAARLTIV